MAPPSAPVYYDGPVCYLDGWHYTVVTDDADKARCLAVAKANLTHATSRGDGDAIAHAQQEVDDAKSRSYDVPGERLHLEDNQDGSESRYRLATDADTVSWHDRKHGQYLITAFDDGQPGLAVTSGEFNEIQEFLKRRREGGS